MLVVERDVKPRNMNFAKVDREGVVIRINTVTVYTPSCYIITVLTRAIAKYLYFLTILLQALHPYTYDTSVFTNSCNIIANHTPAITTWNLYSILGLGW